MSSEKQCKKYGRTHNSNQVSLEFGKCVGLNGARSWLSLAMFVSGEVNNNELNNNRKNNLYMIYIYGVRGIKEKLKNFHKPK